MDKQQRDKALRSIMWDTSISPDDMEELINGNPDKAGRFTREKLFARMLAGLPWFTIISIFPVAEVNEMLTVEVISSLWPKSVQNQYKYVRKRLQEALRDSG